MESRTSPSARLVLAIVCLGVFSTALDQTVVVTALPSVMLDIKIPLAEIDQASWIITGYLLGYTLAMPLVGRISDIYGYPRIYQASLVIFSIGSLMVALASTLPEMVTARVIQAVGGGATVPISMAIASSVMPPGKRALAVGLVGAAAEAGSVLGPLYGGAIINLLSWRWIFWLDIPQTALLIAALALLTNQRRGEGRVDFLGGILLAGALTALIVSLSMRDAFTGASLTPYLLIVLGVFLVGVLVLVERRTWQPLLAPLPVPVSVFPNRQREPAPCRSSIDNSYGKYTFDGQHYHGQGAPGRGTSAYATDGCYPCWGHSWGIHAE